MRTTPEEIASTSPLRLTVSASASNASSLLTAPMTSLAAYDPRPRIPRTAPTRVGPAVGGRALGCIGGPRSGNEELHRLGKALEIHLPDRVELKVVGATDRVDDRGGDHYLPPEGPGDDAVGEVDLGAEVVPIPVDRPTVMEPDARLGALLEETHESNRPLGQGHRVRGDDHHLVPNRLDHERLGGERRLDGLDEALDEVERLLVSLLLRVSGESSEVDEAEGHLHATQLPLPTQLRLHVTDHVLLDVEAEVTL